MKPINFMRRATQPPAACFIKSRRKFSLYPEDILNRTQTTYLFSLSYSNLYHYSFCNKIHLPSCNMTLLHLAYCNRQLLPYNLF